MIQTGQCITRIFVRGRQGDQMQRRGCDDGSRCWSGGRGREPSNGTVSRIWKRQRRDSLLDPQEAMEPGQFLDLSPLKPVFRLLTSVNRGRCIGVVLSYYICGNWLQQQWETNTHYCSKCGPTALPSPQSSLETQNPRPHPRPTDSGSAF